jgi:hypothetical protein
MRRSFVPHSRRSTTAVRRQLRFITFGIMKRTYSVIVASRAPFWNKPRRSRDDLKISSVTDVLNEPNEDGYIGTRACSRWTNARRTWPVGKRGLHISSVILGRWFLDQMRNDSFDLNEYVEHVEVGEWPSESRLFHLWHGCRFILKLRERRNLKLFRFQKRKTRLRML